MTALSERQEHELHSRRRKRNMAVGGVLLGFVALLFAVTMVKLGPNIAKMQTEGAENPRAMVPLGD
ncbi:MAG: hypothetical protein ACPGFA_09935 [Pikeienuella sp.]